MDASFHQLDDAKARAVHLLTCPLCTKQYEDPRVLPCQHTFCCRCLLAYVDRVLSSRAAASSTRRGAFPCPVCLVDVGLPAAGAAAFPVDRSIRNIRDLVVEEMAKDLASRLKGRLQSDGLCNGGGGRHGSTRLSNISERPGVDDDDDDVDVDDPVFTRQTSAYSSVGGGSRARRARTDTPPKHDIDARTFSDFAQTPSETASSDTDAAAFSRDRPGYSSVRLPRTRRARAAAGDAQSMYDSIGRSRGRTMTSSGSLGTGQSSSSQTQSYQRHSSHVDDPATKSSPFDNINRDDDRSEPYTPKIGRNRLAYSSLRERRGRSPMLDPDKLYDSPADFVDEELLSSFGSHRFSYREGRATHSHHPDIRRENHDASGFDAGLRRAASSDNQDWTHCSARGQKLPEAYEFESQRMKSSSHQSVWRNRAEDKTPRPQAQRPENLDVSGLTVLSNLTADMKAAAKGKVFESAAAPTSDRDFSQPQSQLDRRSDVSANPVTYCASNEVPSVSPFEAQQVPSVSHTHNDVASQLSGSCHVELNKTDDTAKSKRAERTTPYSTHSSKNSRAASADIASPSSPVSAGRSTENTDAVDQAHFTFDKPCSTSEERIHSPARSPRSPANESCFSSLTKFRASKNSKHSASSATESTSKEAENPRPASEEVNAGAVPSQKPRVRKRPPVFVGTPYGVIVTGSEEDAATSPPSAVRNDELDCELESSDKQLQVDGQVELHPTSLSDDEVGSSGLLFDAADVKSGHETFNSREAPIVDDAPQTHVVTSSADVSPTADTDVESNDVQSPADDVSDSQPPAHDEDSAVYSATGVDSDVSLKSATELCLPTPTTDDDDDVLMNCPLDEPASTTPGRFTNVIKRDDEHGLTSSADGITTDLNHARHQDGPASTDEVRAKVLHSAAAAENDDATDGAEDADSGDRSSTCSGQNELRHETEYPPQNDDDGITSNDKIATEDDSESVFRTGHRHIHVDEACTDDQLADGYVLATGVAALGDGSLVVADYGAGCVCLCDDEGRAEHRVTGLKPFSVATSTGDDDDGQLVFVGDRRRKTLVALDRYGCDVAQWPDSQFDWICGIACLPDGHLAVLDRSRTRQLGIYAASGEEGRPLTELGGHGSSLGDLCMAEFVAADSRGRVLVADSGNHCVKAFDHRVARPGVVAVYGSTRGSGEAQLEWPKGVAVDSADNVLVADCRNGRVVAFSADGRPLGSVVPAVRGPFALCSLPSDRRRLALATYSVSGLSQFRLYDYNTDEPLV